VPSPQPSPKRRGSSRSGSLPTGEGAEIKHLPKGEEVESRLGVKYYFLRILIKLLIAVITAFLTSLLSSSFLGLYSGTTVAHEAPG